MFTMKRMKNMKRRLLERIKSRSGASKFYFDALRRQECEPAFAMMLM